MSDSVTCANCGCVACTCPVVGGAVTGAGVMDVYNVTVDSESWLRAVELMTPEQRAQLTTCAPLPVVDSTAFHITNTAVYTPIARAWECPRCSAINAPHAERCACAPNFAPPWQPPAQPYDQFSPYGGWGGVQCCALNTSNP